VRKCPYCDFNSHTRGDTLPEEAYVDTLLDDLAQDLARLSSEPRPLVSVFIGGGTPSLFSGPAISRLLGGIRERTPLAPEAEITLEANPGTTDARRFAAYREAGVNRLSLGAQSLSDAHLRSLGRIHGPKEVHAAVATARRAGFENLNLDLMYGLPEQTLHQAKQELQEALGLAPGHVSYYQLTLEPNTAFHAAPPPVPGHDLASEMHAQGGRILIASGFDHYETSAYAGPGGRCRHNLNYWTFGDYLGIGAGAHGKLTDVGGGRIERYAKLRNPRAYLEPANRRRLTGSRRLLTEADLRLEFAMNALRLSEGFPTRLFERRTGLPASALAPVIEAARADGLLQCEDDRIRPTERGRLFLNDLLERFL
jgi:oxygen-independent coproporphyrinogen-3 oxidase